MANVDPKQLEAAEGLGIPLKQILRYMVYQEQKLNAVIENMPTPEAFKNAMNEWVAEEQQKLKSRVPPTGGTTGQGGGLMHILPLLGQFAGQSGGGDQEVAALTKQIMRESIASMRRKADITDRFMDAIIGNISAQYASKVVKNAAGTI